METIHIHYSSTLNHLRNIFLSHVHLLMASVVLWVQIEALYWTLPPPNSPTLLLVLHQCRSEDIQSAKQPFIFHMEVLAAVLIQSNSSDSSKSFKVQNSPESLSWTPQWVNIATCWKTDLTASQGEVQSTLGLQQQIFLFLVFLLKKKLWLISSLYAAFLIIGVPEAALLKTWMLCFSALERPDGASPQDSVDMEEFQQRINAVSLEKVKAYYRRLRYTQLRSLCSL